MDAQSSKVKLRHSYGRHACPLCDQKLESVHPSLAVIFHKMKAIDWQVHISWGYRNEKEQNDFFREGKSEKRFPHSKHNHVNKDGKPCSRAIDVFFLDTPNKASFRLEDYQNLWDNMHWSERERVRWGMTWNDSNHFELRDHIT